MAITALRTWARCARLAPERAALCLSRGALFRADRFSTGPTQAMPAPHDRVGLVKRMAVNAARLLRVVSGEADAAAHIFATGHRIEMHRVHARPVSAQVIELQAGGDRPNHPLIQNAVRGAVLTVDGQRPIAAVAPGASPNPAAVMLLDARQHTLQRIAPRSSHLAGATSRALSVQDVFAVPVVVGERVFRSLDSCGFALAGSHVGS